MPEKKELTTTGIVDIQSLLSKAIDQKISVESMERLLVMAKEMQAIRAKREYNLAIADFQAKCPMIVKTKEIKTDAGEHAYSYAPLEEIVNQVSHLIKKNGFSYSTSMELKENGVRVICKVTHIGGHSEESPMEVPFGNQTRIMSKSQVVAAASTFAKRYAFCNVFGILTGDEDNDGQDLLLNGHQTQKSALQAPETPLVAHYVSKQSVEAQIKNALSLEQALEVEKKMRTAPIKPEYLQYLQEMISRKITDLKNKKESSVSQAMRLGMASKDWEVEARQVFKPDEEIESDEEIEFDKEKINIDRLI